MSALAYFSIWVTGFVCTVLSTVLTQRSFSRLPVETLSLLTVAAVWPLSLPLALLQDWQDHQ